MYVLGTAGHVDHGKSAMVRALTGIDPDRLPEEKKRQMTIDLGFAWFKLPDGREVSIVDVPGHEDFIRNMLAGVAGIDLALLVIAADEGVMPQTREHLAILDFLMVERGIVVVTKKDLVDSEGLELAVMEAEDVIKNTFLSSAPVVAISAFTGEGIPELKATVSRLLDETTRRRDIGRPRLAIDRIFTIKGFGTVVTGTLVDGQLKVGQEIQILPSGLKSAVRRLETHKNKLDTALPGSRVSVNLAGISPEKLERGMVITTAGWLRPSRFLDVRLRAIKGLPREISHNMSVMFYAGTSEVSARIRLLDREKLGAGDVGWAQLKLERPVAVAKDDFFVLRSPQATLGGGQIVDTEPKRHRRFQASLVQNLQARGKGTPEEVLFAILEANGPLEFEKLLQGSQMGEPDMKKALAALMERKQVIAIGSPGAHQLFLSDNRWHSLTQEATTLVQNYHAQFPLRRGMSREELKSRLRVPSLHFDSLLKKTAEDGILVEEEKVVRLPSQTISLSPEQESRVAAYMGALTRDPYSPPADLSLDTELLNMLLQEGRVTKIGEGIIISSAAYEVAVKKITAEIKKRGKITVAEVRDLIDTNRKNAVAFMEYMDGQRITLRIGNERVLRQ
ncbi:MAG: selenocysteine-specific translation elongation factor [Chloroflexota bacterium]